MRPLAICLGCSTKNLCRGLVSPPVLDRKRPEQVRATGTPCNTDPPRRPSRGAGPSCSLLVAFAASSTASLSAGASQAPIRRARRQRGKRRSRRFRPKRGWSALFERCCRRSAHQRDKGRSRPWRRRGKCWQNGSLCAGREQRGRSDSQDQRPKRRKGGADRESDRPITQISPTPSKPEKP